MNHKNNALLICLISMAVLSLASLAAFASLDLYEMDAATTSYTLTLDKNNGGFSNTSYPTGSKETSTAKTSSGNPFSLTYQDVMKSSDSTYSFAQMKKTTGFLYSTYGVVGLTSITVTFKTSDFLYLSTSDSASFSSEKEKLTSGIPVSVSKNYFKLLSGANAVYLSSIVLNYTCSSRETNPSTSASSSASPNSSASSSSSLSYDNFYKVTGNTTTNAFNYKAIKKTDSCDSLVSTGSPKILVLPIELKDYPFASQTLTDLQTVLNGNGASDTGYWESLASFYKKSSFGVFTPSYVVASAYQTNLTPSELMKKNTDSQTASSLILEEAVANYKTVSKDSGTQFDSDHDGLIDATIMVYSCPDASKSSTIKAVDPKGDLFWAYCYWDYDNAANASTTSPIGVNYFWMSYDFIYETVSSPKVDAHTLIHESGHLMGLDDYYCYDDATYNGNTVTPAPMGGVAMMDENVTDHDAFSKIALNWIKPYVVTGNARITIHPSSTSGEAILIPAHGKSWNGTAFDEYMLVELYTPTGLNELDSATKYSYDTKGYTGAGIRLTHVDARIAKYTWSGNTASTSYLTSIPTSFSTSSTVSYGVPQSNTPSRQVGAAKTGNFNILTMIQAGYPQNTFRYGLNKGENANLFTTGSHFTQAAYKAFFAQSTSFDNGASFGYQIDFESVSDTAATIAFNVL